MLGEVDTKLNPFLINTEHPIVDFDTKKTTLGQ